MVDYWNSVDSEIELNMDVIDDPRGEALEIYKYVITSHHIDNPCVVLHIGTNMRLYWAFPTCLPPCLPACLTLVSSAYLLLLSLPSISSIHCLMRRVFLCYIALRYSG
jgi:hypothetical protein